MNDLKLISGATIGTGSKAFYIEKVTSESIYVRMPKENAAGSKVLRLIPTPLVRSLLTAIEAKSIGLEDISRDYRKKSGLPPLLDELNLPYDVFIMGYDSTIQKICEYITNQPTAEQNDLYPTENRKLSKPFLLLAGISGTGKSRFVREQAKASGSLKENYCLVSVRPDWHEPSDLLGYISRLNGDPKYVATDVLQFLTKAWRAIFDSCDVTTDVEGQALLVQGEIPTLNGVLPYWLCLDEMNLAPVEQYFADYLSVLETRDWQWDGDSFEYRCDPILKATEIKQLPAASEAVLRKDLGLEEEKYQTLWDLFCEHGIGIPFNLIVAGTVNMDETTHGFSRKVIDRALSFDFGDFFPNDFDEFFEPSITAKTLSYPIWASAKADLLPSTDSDGTRTIEFLKQVNSVLNNSPFKLAFRAQNELFVAMISHQPADDAELLAVWDDFLMCKLLPRIEGDSDKLAQSDVENSLLVKLSSVLKDSLADIWSDASDSPNMRPDLFRKNNDGVIMIECRSQAKIQWMQGRLVQSGFTSFWP